MSARSARKFYGKICIAKEAEYWSSLVSCLAKPLHLTKNIMNENASNYGPWCPTEKATKNVQMLNWNR